MGLWINVRTPCITMQPFHPERKTISFLENHKSPCRAYTTISLAHIWLWTLFFSASPSLKRKHTHANLLFSRFLFILAQCLICCSMCYPEHHPYSQVSPLWTVVTVLKHYSVLVTIKKRQGLSIPTCKLLLATEWHVYEIETKTVYKSSPKNYASLNPHGINIPNTPTFFSSSKSVHHFINPFQVNTKFSLFQGLKVRK